MKKDNKIILIISLLVVMTIICIILIVTSGKNKNNTVESDKNKVETQNNNSEQTENKTTNSEQIEKKTTNSEEKNFSDYSKYDIDLSTKSNVVEINEKGVYTLTGKLNGYILVNTDENVKLILDNVTITNSNGPAIYVQSAKNTYIELVGNSTISDGTSYSNFEEDVNATIYSKDDLFITGSGSIDITSNYADAIVSKDDLTIYSGTINITSEDDGIRGKDSVTIYDGTINITSNGDGIKTTNAEDTEKGNIIIEKGSITIKSDSDAIQSENNITINGGTFDITTGNGSTVNTKTNGWNNYSGSSDTSLKGIKAVNVLTINNGTFDLNVADDGIHTNGNVVINNGKFIISSSDDGIHADGLVEINGGEINVTASEGIEGTYVKINDGEIGISASDDGINAGNKSTNYSVTIEINGGNVTIKMGQGDTDGIDSNGNLYINGGTIDVTCNSPFDYDGEAKYTGGKLIVNGEETTTITNQMMGGGMRGGRMPGGMIQGRMMR